MFIAKHVKYPLREEQVRDNKIKHWVLSVSDRKASFGISLTASHWSSTALAKKNTKNSKELNP